MSDIKQQINSQPPNNNIYIIKSYSGKGTCMVKLGYSSNIQQRLLGYYSHNPNMELIGTYYREDAAKFEKTFHAVNEASALREWYPEDILQTMFKAVEDSIVISETVPNGYKDYYTAVYSKLITVIKDVRTAPALRVLFGLISFLATQTKQNKAGSSLNITQAELAKAMDMKQPEICRGLKELSEIGLIHSEKRGSITLNPKYFWVGAYAAWQKAVEEQEQLKELANGND